MSTDDESDEQLFRRLMRGVTPLKSRPRADTIRRKKHVAPPTLCISYTLSDPIDLDMGAETLLCHGKAQVARKQFLQLQRGEIKLQARLDLHGFTLTNARKRCAQFILYHQQQGTRYVLIVHGKGARSSAYSVLKSHVNHWLKQMPEVLAFHSAQPQHGGRGALYVLLKAIVNKG